MPDAGLTLLELLVALAMAVVLIASMAPLVTSLSRAGADEADRTLHTVQARVALARFEQDFRTAGELGSSLPVPSPVLEATATRVVCLCRAEPEGASILVEWEMTGGKLMRRWGPRPDQVPDTFTTTLFVDNKTMLEGVRAGSHFTFHAEAAQFEPPLDEAELMRLHVVGLELVLSPDSAGVPVSGSTLVATSAGVGR